MKYYDGSEMLWSIADVQQQADNLDIYLGNEEARQILNATFKDNEYLMQIINEMITENIIKYNELH
mgnify:FL=1|jgi:hypothetical protein|tara:strand:+ start:333 stop:530 length:198 start_codon:yes stop_codon:yes gene_type:complete